MTKMNFCILYFALSHKDIIETEIETSEFSENPNSKIARWTM